MAYRQNSTKDVGGNGGRDREKEGLELFGAPRNGKEPAVHSVKRSEERQQRA